MSCLTCEVWQKEGWRELREERAEGGQLHQKGKRNEGTNSGDISYN